MVRHEKYANLIRYGVNFEWFCIFEDVFCIFRIVFQYNTMKHYY